MYKLLFIRFWVVFIPVSGLLSCNPDHGQDSGLGGPAAPVQVDDPFPTNAPMVTLQFRSDSSMAHLNGTVVDFRSNLGDGITLESDVAFPFLKDNDFSANPIDTEVESTCQTHDASVSYKFTKSYSNQSHLRLIAIVGERNAFMAGRFGGVECYTKITFKNKITSSRFYENHKLQIAAIDDPTDTGVGVISQNATADNKDLRRPIIDSYWGPESHVLPLMSQTTLHYISEQPTNAVLECEKFESVVAVKPQTEIALADLTHAPTTLELTDDPRSAGPAQRCRAFFTDATGSGQIFYSRNVAIVFAMLPLQVSSRATPNLLTNLPLDSFGGPLAGPPQPMLLQPRAFDGGSVSIFNPNKMTAYFTVGQPDFVLYGKSTYRTAPAIEAFTVAMGVTGAAALPANSLGMVAYALAPQQNATVQLTITSPPTVCHKADFYVGPDGAGTRMAFNTVSVANYGRPLAIVQYSGDGTSPALDLYPTTVKLYSSPDQGNIFNGNWFADPVGPMSCLLGL